MQPKNETLSEVTDLDIIITRVVNAPRELVFEAWTDPKHLDKWWGPIGFTNETHEFEFKVGGKWKFTMKSEWGDFPQTITYEEITIPSQLRYVHEGIFSSVVTFAETDGKTTVVMRNTFPTKEGLKEVVEKYGAVEGGKQTIEKLDAYVASYKNDL
jgi:uncharacterized protein YndB with AHSA1/START domain